MLSFFCARMPYCIHVKCLLKLNTWGTLQSHQPPHPKDKFSVHKAFQVFALLARMEQTCWACEKRTASSSVSVKKLHTMLLRSILSCSLNTKPGLHLNYSRSYSSCFPFHVQHDFLLFQLHQVIIHMAPWGLSFNQFAWVIITGLRYNLDYN